MTLALLADNQRKSLPEEAVTSRSSRIRGRSLALAVCCALVGALAGPGLASAVMPKTTIVTDPSAPGPSGWYTAAPIVTLSTDQDGILNWSWDGSATQTATVLAHASRVIGAAPEGDHTLSAWSSNLGGETEAPPVSWPVRVDSSAPSQPGSFDATVTLNVGVRLTWAASADAGSGVSHYAVYRKAGGPPFIATDVIAYTSDTSYLDFPPAFTGDYAYAVSAFDEAGNESAFSDLEYVSTAFSAFVPVYRFYNVRKGVHFYTASEAERASVAALLASTYRFEGTAYRVNTANPANTTPLYRFYNVRKGVHFYTASESEKANVIATLSSTYNFEGTAYRVSLDPSGGATPVYRFYNARKGVHFYTASEAERASVAALLASTYHFEGVGYYLAP